MKVHQQINDYIESLPDQKSNEMLELHKRVLHLLPDLKLWFTDGKDDNGKVVSNPSIGYGSRLIQYTDGKTKEWFQIGLSANTAGISVYILGIEDKTYLSKTYGKKIGKATVTGYCIKFKKISDIDIHVLENALKDGVALTKA